MKVLGNTTLAKDTDSKYPFGANIQDETPTINGTPVVREVYGDLLMNLYRLLELTNEVPNDSEDNKNTTFQIVNAIKKLANEINDIQHVLNYEPGGFRLNLDFNILPNNFVCIVRPTENYSILLDSFLIDINDNSKPLFTDGFKASSDVMLIISTGSVRAVELSRSNVNEKVFTVFGNPLNFNATQNLGYNNNGKLLYDDLSFRNIEEEIRVLLSDGTLIVNDMFVGTNSNNVSTFFSVKKPSDNSVFKMFYYIGSGTYEELEFVGYIDAPNNSDNPLVLCDGLKFYISNGSGSVLNDYTFDIYNIDYPNNQLLFYSRVDLDASYIKTENTTIHNGYLYTYLDGDLIRYDMNTGLKQIYVNLGDVNGQLFNFNGGLYLTTGEIATKLNV